MQIGNGNLVTKINKVNLLPLDLRPVSIYRWYHAANPDVPGDKEAEVAPLDWPEAGMPFDEVLSAAKRL